MKQKRCVELQIPHSNRQTQYRCMITHRASESVYTVSLSAVNGLTRLTTKSVVPHISFVSFVINY